MIRRRYEAVLATSDSPPPAADTECWRPKLHACLPIIQHLTSAFRFQMQDPSLKSNGDRMRAISRSQLSEDVLNVHFDGATGRAQPPRDLFVGESLGYECQYFHLARRERDLREVIGQTLGDFRRHQPLAGVN